MKFIETLKTIWTWLININNTKMNFSTRHYIFISNNHKKVKSSI